MLSPSCLVLSWLQETLSQTQREQPSLRGNSKKLQARMQRSSKLNTSFSAETATRSSLTSKSKLSAANSPFQRVWVWPSSPAAWFWSSPKFLRSRPAGQLKVWALSRTTLSSFRTWVWSATLEDWIWLFPSTARVCSLTSRTFWSSCWSGTTTRESSCLKSSFSPLSPSLTALFCSRAVSWPQKCGTLLPALRSWWWSWQRHLKFCRTTWQSQLVSWPSLHVSSNLVASSLALPPCSSNQTTLCTRCNSWLPCSSTDWLWSNLLSTGAPVPRRLDLAAPVPPRLKQTKTS